MREQREKSKGVRCMVESPYVEIKYFQFVQQSLLFSCIVYGRNRRKSICFCMGTFEAFSSIMCFLMHVQCNTDVTDRLVWILVLDSLVGKAPDYRFGGLGSIPSLVHLFLFSHYIWCPANHWNWQVNSCLRMSIYKCKDHFKGCDSQTGSNTSAR